METLDETQLIWGPLPMASPHPLLRLSQLLGFLPPSCSCQSLCPHFANLSPLTQDFTSFKPPLKLLLKGTANLLLPSAYQTLRFRIHGADDTGIALMPLSHKCSPWWGSKPCILRLDPGGGVELARNLNLTLRPPSWLSVLRSVMGAARRWAKCFTISVEKVLITPKWWKLISLVDSKIQWSWIVFRLSPSITSPLSALTGGSPAPPMVTTIGPSHSKYWSQAGLFGGTTWSDAVSTV